MMQNTCFWKVPAMWLVIGLPLASMVAGIGLVVTAVRSGGADVVRDEVRRVSQIQTTDLGPDQRALALSLSAVLRVGTDVLEVIPAGGTFARQAPLRLVLEHPTRASDDVQIELMPTSIGWRGARVLDAEHDWNVEVAPVGGEWRLRGRLPKHQRAVRLAPILAH